MGAPRFSQKSSDVMIQLHDTHRKICGIWFKHSTADSAVLVDLTGGVSQGSAQKKVVRSLKRQITQITKTIANLYLYLAMEIVLVLFAQVLR